MNIFIVWSARPSTAAAVAITTPAASPRRASVNPGARPANERVSAAALAQPRVRDAVAQLMVRVVHISLDEATRAHFLAQMTDAAATKRGRTVRADALLADVVDDVPGLVDAVLAGRVPGFTAPALRFTVELATSLAEHQEVRVQREQERATAVSRKDLSVAEVLACRTELVQRTRDVLPGDAPERAALQRAAKLPSRKLDGALAAVEATLGVVEAVFTRAEGDATYGAYLTAMGFTRASLGAVTAPVRPALEARSSHREAYTAGGVAQQEVDRIEGRLYAQLLRLRERAAAARGAGAVVPTVRAGRVLRVKRAKKAATPEGATVTSKAAKKAKPANEVKAPAVVSAPVAGEVASAAQDDASQVRNSG